MRLSRGGSQPIATAHGAGVSGRFRRENAPKSKRQGQRQRQGTASGVRGWFNHGWNGRSARSPSTPHDATTRAPVLPILWSLDHLFIISSKCSVETLLCGCGVTKLPLVWIQRKALVVALKHKRRTHPRAGRWRQQECLSWSLRIYSDETEPPHVFRSGAVVRNVSSLVWCDHDCLTALATKHASHPRIANIGGATDDQRQE